MKIIWVSFLMLVASFAHAQLPADCQRKLPEPLTYEILRARVEACHVRSVEDLLTVFPDSFLANYTLVHDARGRQQASVISPRAILFGHDASLVVAFNGDPAQRAYEDLELMQFRADTKRFEFRRITFPEGAAANLPAAVFSNANPMECAGCHRREDPRPNWDGGLLWPGVFGAEDDFIFRPGGSTANTDGERYREFFRQSKNRGRYRFLSAVHATDSALPNTFLGIKLGALNFQNVARRIAEQPAARPYRFALLGTVSCPQMTTDAFLPPNVLAKAPHTFAALAQDGLQFNNESFRMRLARLRSSIPTSPENPRIAAAEKEVLAGRPVYGTLENNALAGFRLIAEDLLGLPVRMWSMEVGSRHYVFADGAEGLAALRGPLQDEFFKADFRFARRRSLSPVDCEELRRQSLAELSRF